MLVILGCWVSPVLEAEMCFLDLTIQKGTVLKVEVEGLLLGRHGRGARSLWSLWRLRRYMLALFMYISYLCSRKEYK